MSIVAATVSILDRKYKLKIDSNEEPFMKKAAKLVDEQARNYAKLYAYQDYQDLLAMVALTQITQLTKLQDSLSDSFGENAAVLTTDQQQRLEAIDKLLTNAIG